MEEITIKLPLELIKQILRRVPAKELEKLRKKEIKSVPADYLLKLAGIVAIGGNAMEDTERVWE